VNPWLLGVLGLGLVGLLASKGSTPTPYVPPAPPPPQATGGGGTSLTPSNIQAAFKIALAHETNVPALSQFGTALMAYGYGSQGNALLAKAARIMGQQAAHLTPPGSSGPSPGAHLKPGHSTSYTIPGSGGFGPETVTSTAPTKATVQWWINHYAGTSLDEQHPPTQAQVQKAVQNALAHETDHTMLIEFAATLQQFQQPGVYEDPSGIESLEEKALAPWVKKYAGTDKVTKDSLDTAISHAKAHGSASDLMHFGQTLAELSTALPDGLFGQDWTADGLELQNAGVIAQATAHGTHHHG